MIKSKSNGIGLVITSNWKHRGRAVIGWQKGMASRLISETWTTWRECFSPKRNINNINVTLRLHPKRPDRSYTKTRRKSSAENWNKKLYRSSRSLERERERDCKSFFVFVFIHRFNRQTDDVKRTSRRETRVYRGAPLIYLDISFLAFCSNNRKTKTKQKKKERKPSEMRCSRKTGKVCWCLPSAYLVVV